MADAALAAMLQRAAEEPSDRFVAEMLRGTDGGGATASRDGDGLSIPYVSGASPGHPRRRPRWYAVTGAAAAVAIVAGAALLYGGRRASESIDVDPASSATTSTVVERGDEVPLIDLDYGEGRLSVPVPPIDGIGAPVFRSIPTALAASGERPPSTVSFQLPTELPGAFVGEVNVTAIAPSTAAAVTGADAGIDGLRGMAISPDNARGVDLGGVPVLFVPVADVIPGAAIGKEDRISSQLIWRQPDGAVIQLISDLMTEAELLDYAADVIEASA